LLAVKSIFHYYSWQWQLVVGFLSHLVIRPWPWPAIHDMSEKASEIRVPDGCAERRPERTIRTFSLLN